MHKTERKGILPPAGNCCLSNFKSEITALLRPACIWHMHAKFLIPVTLEFSIAICIFILHLTYVYSTLLSRNKQFQSNCKFLFPSKMIP